MSKKFFCAASALALAVTSALAQSSSDPKTQLAYLDPVVVTGSRFEQSLSDVPALAQVISKEEISQSGVASVGEAVNKLGNINVRSPQGGQLGVLADIDMRGFGASARDNTLILVDGMRVSPIDSGSIMWESIPINTVERIEIIHGGGSVQFGDKAVGGVINIITRGDLTQKSSASVTAGSYGTMLSNASLITGWGNTKAKIDMVANTSDGWRENSQTQQGTMKGLLSHSLGGQDRIFIEALYSSQQFHTPGGVVGEVNTGDRRAAKFNNVNEKTTTNGSRGLVGLAKSFGDGWQFLAEAAYSDSGSTQARPYYAADANPASAGQIIYDKWSADITPRLKKIWNANNDSVFGYDYQRATAVYRPDTGDRQSATIENKSVYATHRYFLTPVFEISGGVRRQIQNATAHDKSTDFWGSGATSTTSATKQQSANAADLALTYRFGASQKDKIFVRSNRAYRFANTDEYWGCDYDVSWNCVRSFKGILRPQKTDTIEMGGSLMFGQRSVLTGTVFQSDSTDEIRYRYAEDANINSPKIRRQGTTLQLRLPLAQQLALHSGLTWQHSEYLDGDYAGKEVPLVPQVMANIGAVFEANRSLSYRMNLNYTGSQRYMDDDSNTRNRMPSFAVLDFGARLRERSWEFDFQIKNATDRKYANYGGYGFITTPTGSRDSYFYYPGDPRTFWLSARYKFN